MPGLRRVRKGLPSALAGIGIGRIGLLGRAADGRGKRLLGRIGNSGNSRYSGNSLLRWIGPYLLRQIGSTWLLVGRVGYRPLRKPLWLLEGRMGSCSCPWGRAGSIDERLLPVGSGWGWGRGLRVPRRVGGGVGALGALAVLEFLRHRSQIISCAQKLHTAACSDVHLDAASVAVRRIRSDKSCGVCARDE